MGKVTKSLIAGAAIGAIAALLLSPKSGKQNRKDLHENYDKVRKQLADELAKAKELSHEGYATLVDHVTKMHDSGGISKAEVAALKRDLLSHWKHATKPAAKPKKKPTKK